MVEFFTWRLTGHSLVTVLLVLCVLAQTPAVILGFYRRPYNRARILENLMEIPVLFHIIVLSILHGESISAHISSILYFAGYGDLRYVADVAVIFIVLFACILVGTTAPGRPRKTGDGSVAVTQGSGSAASPSFVGTTAPGRPRKTGDGLVSPPVSRARLLPVIAFACLTLPLVEAAAGGVFAWLYIAALLFWLLRGIRVCILRYREIKTGISSVSIKNTIDFMHTGVLFSAPDGHILLSNERMSGLMTILTGRIHRDANLFYEALVHGTTQGDGSVVSNDTTEPSPCVLPLCPPPVSSPCVNGQLVCRLPDQTVWNFIKKELRIGNRTYIQLTADDITERWALTEQLRRQEGQLKLRGDELKDTIANLHVLSREKELLNTKLRAHDVLGGWLTMLLHTIRNEQALDLDMLRSQSQSLPQNLIQGQGTASPREKFDGLRRTFETIGVEIQLEGDLPGDLPGNLPGDIALSQSPALSPDEAIGHLFMDVISEGVVNAVRHGFATSVSVRITHSDEVWHLEVTDNGRPPAWPIFEGGGIGGMRKKLEPHGGVLRVTTHPRFVLTVDLPEK